MTALQAVEEMDAGPIWGTRTFPIAPEPPRKSNLCVGPVTTDAIALIREVVAKATDPSFAPEPLDERRPDVPGRLQSMMRQTDRDFSWSDGTDHILRRIRAADGSPGVQTTLCGTSVSVFDAHPGPDHLGPPGTIALRRHGAVLVCTGDGTVWVGHVRLTSPSDGPSVKLPATLALGDRLHGVCAWLPPEQRSSRAGLRRDRPPARRTRRRPDLRLLQRRHVDRAVPAVGRRSARRRAQDTNVLVLQGGEVFSNGIHLNVIEAASSPAMEAWRNINAIDEVCRQILTCTNQLVVASVAGNAGAGGVMLALGADRVDEADLARYTERVRSLAPGRPGVLGAPRRA